ncbi:MAG: MurR/RpiR family transcriptional regulator [Ignavibacteria bacterium]|jgi:DNA-binding MurR/RpiR family transcriptional regulator
MKKMNNRPQLEQKIKSKLNSLTKTEKKIADFFLEKNKDIAFLSIQDLSKQLNLGRASILRFANKLGYDGFASLKKEIINQVQNEISPLEKFKTILDSSSDENLSINKIAQTEVDNINFLLNNFDERSFNKAIDKLLNANNIYVAGMSLSSFLTGLTSYLLQRIGLQSFPLYQSGLTFTEQLININSKDVLLAFSFPPYSPETIEAAKFAKKQKAKVISITNAVTSPIIKFSSVNLLLKTDSQNFTNSLSPIIVMINAITTEVASKNKNKSMKAIDKVISTR